MLTANQIFKCSGGKRGSQTMQVLQRMQAYPMTFQDVLKNKEQLWCSNFYNLVICSQNGGWGIETGSNCSEHANVWVLHRKVRQWTVRMYLPAFKFFTQVQGILGFCRLHMQ